MRYSRRTTVRLFFTFGLYVLRLNASGAIIRPMLKDEEIEAEYDVEGVEVETPLGMRRVSKVFKTVPLPVWRLETKMCYVLEAAGDHLVKSEGEWVKLRNLEPGDLVNTEVGMDTVVRCADTGRVESLYDISVDDPSHSFYSNGILSHNSTTVCTRLLMNSHMLPGYQGLYVVPNDAQRKTTADRLEQMESRFAANVGNQNLYTKKYSNGSIVYMLHCGETANDARGKSSWEIIIDEAQSMEPSIIPDILECNSKSPLPIVLFTGTALSTETLLEQEWQKSSQGVWHIKAGDGKTWLNMHDEETLLKVCDNPSGPTCPITGKLLDVTDGHYVHGYRERLDRGYIGLHVPQVIIKDNVDSPLQWQKLYKKRTDYDTNKFLMECCGIAMAEGMREITQADLERICDLKVDKEDIRRRCERGYYRLIVSGCDWGGSDYNQAAKTKLSYTVHCMLGVAPNGTVDILHFNRYAGMEYKSIGEDIVANHVKYKGHVMASDYGVGAAYNAYMREHMPVMSHFVAQLMPPSAAPLAPVKNSNLPNHVGINKTEAITNVFTDLKSGRIHAMAWDRMAQYLTDFLNVYRAPVDTEQGMTKFRWIRSATKADDALMAFAFAYVFVKMFLGEKLVEDRAFERYIMDVLTGSPMGSSRPPAGFNYVIS